MPEQSTTREQPIIERGQGTYGDITVIGAYGHELGLDTKPNPLVRINAPSFFRDTNFVRWLNSPESRAATWHARGNEPAEGSDVFIHYGGAEWKGDKFYAESSDYPGSPERPGIPEPIMALIAEAVRAATGSAETEALVWISNLGD